MRVRRSSATPPTGRAPRRRSNQVPGLGSLRTSPSARRARRAIGERALERVGGETLQRRRECAPGGRSAACRGRGSARRRPRGASCAAASASRCSDVGGQLGFGRGARKPIEAGDARADGHAIVAPARRQVEHVAGLEQPLVARREVGAASSAARRRAARRARRGRRASAAGRRPAAGRRRRNRMRADAAAVARERAHHVVEARIGDEAEAIEQPVRARRRAGRRLARARSSRAATAAGSARRAERPVAQRSSARRCATTRRDSTSSCAASANRRAAVEPAAACSLRARRTDQQRLFLPVTAHESRRPKGRRARPPADQDSCFIVR